MIINYRIGRNDPIAPIQIDGFQAFEAWLVGLGAGRIPIDGEILAEWAKLWRALRAGIEGDRCIALTRAGSGKTLTIIGASAIR